MAFKIILYRLKHNTWNSMNIKILWGKTIIGSKKSVTNPSLPLEILVAKQKKIIYNDNYITEKFDIQDHNY